jgi:hypothetical protein
MPATPGREIEHKTAWPDQWQKTVDPGGWSGRGLWRLHAHLQWRQPIAKCKEPITKHGPEVISMILFMLRCARGHQFEGWFRDGDGFEAQQKAGEISCPECGETRVEKAVMAPRIGKSVRSRRLALGLGVVDDPGGRA